MKKNKEWAIKEAKETIIGFFDRSSRGVARHYEDELIASIAEIIDQLDEPEVLSQEWIERNTSPVDDEGRLYVWKSDLQNAIVPKQELPVIPKFVAEYINDRKEVSFPIYQAIRIVRENSRFEHSHLREWLWTNKGQETFARAWLDGFTVEEEQRYYVEDGKHALLCKWESFQAKVKFYEEMISKSNFRPFVEELEE